MSNEHRTNSKHSVKQAIAPLSQTALPPEQIWRGTISGQTGFESPWNNEQEPSDNDLGLEEKQALESQRYQLQHMQQAQNIASMYMSKLGEVPLLTAEQEWALAAQLQQQIKVTWIEILLRPKGAALLCGLLEKKIDHPLHLMLVEIAQIHPNLPLQRKLSERMRLTILRKIEPIAACCHKADLDLLLLEAFIDKMRRLVFDRQVIEPDPRMRFTHQDRIIIERSRGAIIRIRNHFMRANLRLVVSVAARFHHHRMGLLDFVQEGNIGLLKAVHRFDHEKKFRFSTYAHWWIRQAIERSILNTANTIRLPGHVAEAKRKIYKDTLSLTQSLQRPPTRTELADHMALPEGKVDHLLTLNQEPSSLDDQINGQDSRKLVDMVADWSSLAADEAIIHESDRYQLRTILENLSPTERRVIRAHFGLDAAGKQTLQEIAVQMQLSRERIRQIEQNALRRIRRMIEAQQMMEQDDK